MVVLEILDELPDGAVQDRVLEVRRELRERAEHERALGEQQVGDVQVVRRRDDRVAVEEDVDVERARREAEEALAASQPQPQIQPEPPSAPSTAATVG